MPGARTTGRLLLAICFALMAASPWSCCDDCPNDPCRGRVLSVSPEGEAPFPTIQSAIEAARDGDTIELADGRFTGPGNRDISLLGKAITVRSLSQRADACTIDCQGSEEDPHIAFFFGQGEDDATRLESVTISNGFTDRNGGGIVCTNQSSPTLASLVIRDCLAPGHGGGLYAEGASKPTVSSCVFESNRAGGGGGLSASGASPVILYTRFDGNIGGYGGALELWVSVPGEPVVEGCTFVNNTGGSGGAIYVQLARPVIRDCVSSLNYGNFGGFIFCVDASPVVMRCTSFSDRADHWGSALHCQGSCQPQLISCTLSHGNSYYQPSGAAIHAYDDSDVFLTKCIVSFTLQGQAASCTHPLATVTLSCSDVYGNDYGDWTECLEGQLGIQGNICADPLFCDPAEGDLHLTSESPCRGDSSSCGQIGALSTRCD